MVQTPATRVVMVDESGPTQTELSIQYSVSVKGTLPHNKFENATASVSRSEKWDVTGMAPDDVDEFYLERYDALNDLIGKIIEQEYDDITSEAE